MKWNNILWNTLKVLLVIILNTPLLVHLIGSFVPYGTIGEFRLSWIDYLKLSDNIAWYHIWILYIFIPVGILLLFSKPENALLFRNLSRGFKTSTSVSI